MEARMCRGIRCGFCGLEIQARSTESADGTVGHGLAAFNCGLIFEVEEDVGLGRGVEGFGVPSWRAQTLRS